MLPAEHFKIKKYFFPEQVITANPSYDPEKQMEASVDLKVDCWPFDEEKDRFAIQVSMNLDGTAHGGKNFPYAFYVSAHGSFQYIGTAKIDKDELCSHAKAIGSQILVGALRERIIELSARGPWGEFMLDTVGVKALMESARSHLDENASS